MEQELFARAPIPRAYFKMALPVVLSMLVSLVYNMVDTWFIAQTQNTALVAGVSLCAPMFTLMVAMGDIFGLGGSSLISRLLGQGEEKRVRHVSAFCSYGAIVWGVLVGALMLIFRQPILHLLGASSDTMDSAMAYYSYLALGAPAIIFTLVPSNILRTEGMAVASMVGSITGTVVNIILDPIFIFGLNMGAGGAALATVLSNVVSAVLLIVLLVTKSQQLSVRPGDCSVQGKELREILVIGVPASITNLMQSFAMTLTNRFLLPYGTENVAALGIALKVNMIVMLIMVGFAFGAQPLLGYNYGANNRERLRDILKFDVLVQLVFSVVMTVVFLISAPQIIRIFMSDGGVIQAGSRILRCMVISMPLMGIILVCTTLFQAAGKAMPAFLLSISRQGVALLICMVVLSAVLGFYGVILAQAAADVVSVILALVLLKRSDILK
ncbi:MAG: MATE family efflux transporter [Oscillospiraceae bacterium]|nr:MATE family efflux transporter [Oscillospiraceae bacterium]